MRLKKTIALFCILIFSIQILPLRQIGSLLCGNTMNEEIPHGPLTIKETSGKYVPFQTLDYLNSSSLASVYMNNCKAYIGYASILPANHIKEIHTPPPNHLI